jgi:hypothetical protein
MNGHGGSLARGGKKDVFWDDYVSASYPVSQFAMGVPARKQETCQAGLGASSVGELPK